jgi:hypothetical protein
MQEHSRQSSKVDSKTQDTPVVQRQPDRAGQEQPKPRSNSRNPLEAIRSEPEPTPQVTDDFSKEVDEFEQSLPKAYDGMSSKTKESWDKMRDSMKQTKKEALEHKRALEALRKEVEDAKSNTPSVDVDRFKKLEAENKSFKEKNAIWELEVSDDFQNHIEAPLNNAYQSLDQIVTTFSIDPSKVDAAFRAKPGPERNKALSEIVDNAEMTAFDAEDFKKAVGTIMDLSFKKQQAYHNAHRVNEATQERMKAERAERDVLTKREFDAADKKFYDKLSNEVRVIKDLLKDTGYAQELREMVKAHRSSEPDIEVKLLQDYAPYLLPKLVEMYEKEIADHGKTKAALKARVGGDAPAGAGHTPASAPQNRQEENLQAGEDVGRAFMQWKQGQR